MKLRAAVSLGCIRMLNSDVIQVYNRIKVGTPVVVTKGNVLIQARGVDAVNAEASTQGLAFPALGYWPPEDHCFVKPAPGDCNGVFKS